MDVFIGKKGAMAYVLAVVTAFSTDDKVVIKARGRNISIAVDVAEIVRNRFLQEAKLDKIEIGTETIEERAVSTMEITMSRKKRKSSGKKAETMEKKGKNAMETQEEKKLPEAEEEVPEEIPKEKPKPKKKEVEPKKATKKKEVI